MYPCLDFNQSISEVYMIELAYQQFKKDFIETPSYLSGCVYIDPYMPPGKPNNKEKAFWHIITRGDKSTESGKRIFDPQRACRVGWIKNVIMDYAKEHVRLFYYYEKRSIRLYLWLYEFDFIVILQRKSQKAKGVFIVTSFYIDKNHNKKTYYDRYESYRNQKDPRLKDCEWF
ncbi:hypothetical protein [Helicobacter suis]|uniref:hypothetical protein n=1 Tax=Helicobacter suis TaxID=104628 RepID=UPI0013D1210B|nr:hypothetical protein [Helicobacter suis]